MLLADNAYSSGKIRDLLHARGIKVVIPEKADAIARRQAKGLAGGRPLHFDADAYKDRNVVERYFNKLKNWRGIATRYRQARTRLPWKHCPGLNRHLAPMNFGDRPS